MTIQQLAVTFVFNQKWHSKRTRQFIKHCLQRKTANLRHVDSADNIADPLTKLYGKDIFSYFADIFLTSYTLREHKYLQNSKII